MKDFLDYVKNKSKRVIETGRIINTVGAGVYLVGTSSGAITASTTIDELIEEGVIVRIIKDEFGRYYISGTIK